MEITVGMGEIEVVNSRHVLTAVGVGSCVAVALYDANTKIGGLAHVVYPRREAYSGDSVPTRYADIAIGLLLEKMAAHGARYESITAKIFGGANMFPEIILPEGPMDIGRRNVEAVKEVLKKAKISIIAEDVGKHIGRTVLFDTGDGSVEVKIANTEKSKY